MTYDSMHFKIGMAFPLRFILDVGDGGIYGCNGAKSIMFLSRLLDPLRIKLTAQKGSQNIAERRQASGTAWDEHLSNSRQFMSSVLTSAGKGKAVILGSGHLFDVPIEHLCERFAQVVLVDIDHPKAAQDAVRKYPQVELVTCDVTGIIKTMVACARKGSALPKPCPPEDLLEDADFVVSLNLVSQIPLWPHTFLTHLGGYDDKTIHAYMADLIESHLTWLRSAKGKVCIIGDTERRLCQKSKIIEREDTLFGVRLGPCQKTWIWNIAPAPLSHAQYDVRHKVCAFVL